MNYSFFFYKKKREKECKNFFFEDFIYEYWIYKIFILDFLV